MPEIRTNDLDALGVENIRAVLCGDVRERVRDHANIKWRASGDPEMKDVRILTGYPAEFSKPYTLYEGKSFVITEEVDPHFFDDVLEDDCHLNYSHESPSAMCRNNPHMPPDKQNGPGSMELSVDAHGLRVFARVPMNDLDAQRLAPKMDNGVVGQMSYAFTVAEEDCLQTTDELDRDVYHYTLKRCQRMYDVTVCPLGANERTEAMLRSVFAGQLGGRSDEGQPTPNRSDEGSAADEGRSNKGSCTSPLVAEAMAARLRFKPRKE